MTGPLHTSTKKRKISDSPTRKKARTSKTVTPDAPETTTQTATGTVPNPVGSDPYADFLRAIGGEDQLPPIQPLVGTPAVAQTVTPTPTAPATVTGPKPTNPFAGKVKKLRANFGTGYHDVAHFQATRNKPYHGVWEGSRKKVQGWVKMALDSIYDNDRFVVGSKPGQDGGYTYLISMDGATVGYLSGSSVPPGEKPPAKHIEVYLDKKGNTVSAFPSSPDIF